MAGFSCIDVATAKQLITRGAQIADIRDLQSFTGGHIPGAVHLHNGNLPQFLNESEWDVPLIVCCYHGISSRNAAQYLAEQGFEQVYSLDGGYQAWATQVTLSQQTHNESGS